MAMTNTAKASRRHLVMLFEVAVGHSIDENYPESRYCLCNVFLLDITINEILLYSNIYNIYSSGAKKYIIWSI